MGIRPYSRARRAPCSAATFGLRTSGTALALCSGLMDGVRGQVLTVDRGTTFFDNLIRLYEERESLGL